MADASGDLSALYNQRYAGDYRSSLAGYEVARFAALKHFVRRVARVRSIRQALDYGCGSGLHVPLWEELFPGAELHFADISSTALEKLSAKRPAYASRCTRIEGHRATSLPDSSFDVVTSIEVMEHVENLRAYLADIHRLLRPGGVFLWTTPCANALSIEHLYARFTRQVDATADGSRRFRWEDPTHLRRLTSAEARRACLDAGFAQTRFRYRAHFFSFVCTRLIEPTRPRLAERLMLLDYSLLRRLPNAASMIGAAWKPGPHGAR